MNKNGVLGIIIALSIGMIGATIVVSYGALQAQAAKSGTDVAWCYGTLQGRVCFQNHGDCTKEAQVFGTTGCYKIKFEP